MYIKVLIADINYVLTVAIIGFIILIFPIFINFYLLFSLINRKLYFTINIFGLISLFSGYAEITKYGVAIHFGKLKAIIFNFNDINLLKKKFKPLKDYHILKLALNFELGVKNSMTTAVSIGFILNYFENLIKWVIQNRKPYFKTNNTINVYEGKDIFNIYLNSIVVLNLLMILISLIKIIMEKIYYAASSRRKQNKQSN